MVDATDGDAASDGRVVSAALEHVARDGWHQHARLRRGLVHEVGAAGVHAAFRALAALALALVCVFGDVTSILADIFALRVFGQFCIAQR